MRREAVRAVAITARHGDLTPLARALRLVKGKEPWRRMKGPGDRYRCRCPKCGCGAMEAINESVKKKRHTKAAHRRRTVIQCLLCGTQADVLYGG
jgi:hypothetical protein